MSEDEPTVVPLPKAPAQRRPARRPLRGGRVHPFPLRKTRDKTARSGNKLDHDPAVRELGAQLILEVATLPATGDVSQRSRMFALVGQLLTAYERANKRAKRTTESA